MASTNIRCTVRVSPYSHQQENILYRVSDVHAIASRSEYFEALMHRWSERQQNDNCNAGVDTNAEIDYDAADESVVYEIQPPEYATALGMRIVLTLLDKGILSDDAIHRLNSSLIDENEALHVEILELCFFLGAEDFALPIYCEHSHPKPRIQAVHALCRKGYTALQIEKIISISGFFREIHTSCIPLHSDFLLSLSLVTLLLNAYVQSRTQTQGDFPSMVVSAFAAMFSPGIGRYNYDSPTTFAVKALVQFCSSEYYSDEIDSGNFQTILQHLPDKCSAPKPDRIEDLFCQLLLERSESIPKIFYGWEMDPVQVAPALLEASSLEQVALFHNRAEILSAVTDEWSTEECLENLANNKAGLRRLVVSQLEHDCQWLARVPKLLDICRYIITTIRNNQTELSLAQQIVYRRLFLHIDFDPMIPAVLLETLPLRQEDFRLKALEHAVLYLEYGNLHPVDVPWEMARSELVQRAAVALEQDESHVVWRRLDISKLDGRYLYCVPVKILAVQALKESRENKKSLEKDMGKLQRTVNEIARLFPLHQD